MKILVCTVKPGMLSGIVAGQSDVYHYMERSGGLDIEYFYYGQKVRRREGIMKKIFLRGADLFRLINKIKSFKPDIIHIDTSHNFKSLVRDVITLFVLSQMRQKVFTIFHGTNFEGIYLKTLCRWLTRYIVRRTRGVGLLSKGEKRRFSHEFPDVKSYIVRCGINISRLRRASKTKLNLPLGINILYSGRVMREKGIMETIEAFRVVSRKVARARLIVVGDGTQMREVRALVRENELGGRVLVKGYVGEDAAYFKNCDLFILPTYCYEGFPTALIKALVVGKPIITTRSRGSIDYLREPDNCLWVKPKRADDIADKILRIISQPPLRKNMSHNNSRLGAIFSDREAAERLIAVYKKI